MTLRDPQDTVESLRATLQKLELTVDPGEDEAAKAELKRILLHRIAELEMVKALEPVDTRAAEPAAADDLVLPASISGNEEKTPEPDQVSSNPLEKLD